MDVFNNLTPCHCEECFLRRGNLAFSFIVMHEETPNSNPRLLGNCSCVALITYIQVGIRPCGPRNDSVSYTWSAGLMNLTFTTAYAAANPCAE